jgi:hypothetical protein
MAYNADGLKLISVGGAIEGTFPDAGGVKSTYSYISNDTLETILADGYFDGITGDPLVAGDTIIAVSDVDGTPETALLVVTVGGGNVTVQVSSGVGPIETISLTTSVLSNRGVSKLLFAASKTVQLAAPYAGARKVLTKDSGNSTIVVTVSATDASANFDGGTKQTIVFTFLGESVMLFGLSATRWVAVPGVISAAAVGPVIT